MNGGHLEIKRYISIEFHISITMSYVKSVVLDAECQEIYNKQPKTWNFSEWVREKLKEDFQPVNSSNP